MKISIPVFLICLLSFFRTSAQDFDKFSENFVIGYQALDIKHLQLSYVANLEQIKSAEQVKAQIAFFKSTRSALGKYKLSDLTADQQLDLQLIRYETDLNLQRLNLESAWLTHRQTIIPDSGLYKLPDGKKWYLYFLKAWLGANVSPAEIYAQGLKDVVRVNKHIEAIRLATGLNEGQFNARLNSKEFYTSDTLAILYSFQQVKAIIGQHLNRLFHSHDIPPLTIKRSKDLAHAQAPGYYNSNVFYYSMIDKPYNKRQIDWLFLHEAIPGHHYKLSINAAAKKSRVQELFFYPGFEEGWAAYTEELGKDLGLYRTPYDELGKWEWDIVRSVRVPMDIGINYYGWTDQQALAFWKQHVKNQDDIALREIARLKRWPAQAISYKYGYWQIMEWKQVLQKKQGKLFDIRSFHDQILNAGSSPIFLVKAQVMK